MPPGPGDESSVTLVDIGAFRFVNRLPTDQVLTFGMSPGLTVIYGDNGTGKSGFARVIKKACRTRGALPKIQPDVFAGHSPQPATAQITFRIHESVQTLTWTDGKPCDSRLANIFVFDTVAAHHYLDTDGPTSFAPLGLDILPKLSSLCDQVSAAIQTEIDALTAEIKAKSNSWRCEPGTTVANLIAALSAATKTSDIHALSSLNSDENERLKQINEALGSDSKLKVLATRASANRIRAFHVELTSHANALSNEKIAHIRQLAEENKTASVIAATFATNQFDATYLPGTGDNIWRSLWIAARNYAISGPYLNQDYPPSNDNAKCVLCQQELAPDAIRRMAAFDAFVKNQSQELAIETKKRLQDAAEPVTKLNGLSVELTKIEADLSTMPPEDLTLLLTFIRAIDARLAATKNNLSADLWADPSELPPFSADALLTLADKHDAHATLEQSTNDPTQREALQKEGYELTARQWLADTRDDVLKQIERHKHLEKLKRCKKDTVTKAITDKNVELTKLLVSKTFCDRFAEEIKTLGLKTLVVKMHEADGKKGVKQFGPRLENATGHDLKDIASEGEQRCVALAAFLAELSLAAHKSTLVFDDPVSSLDHGHREKIAARLAKEAKTRQVIVLTHDPVLVNDLEHYSRVSHTSIEFRHLAWEDGPGRCLDGLPWNLKSFEDRIDKLNKCYRELSQRWQPIPTEQNELDMKHSYSLLRATIERCIERDVCGDVIYRFRSYIKITPQTLQKVVGFQQDECEELLRLHKICCDVTEAHDSAPGKHTRVPDPAQFAQDLEDVQTVINLIRQRQNVDRSCRKRDENIRTGGLTPAGVKELTP